MNRLLTELTQYFKIYCPAAVACCALIADKYHFVVKSELSACVKHGADCAYLFHKNAFALSEPNERKNFERIILYMQETAIRPSCQIHQEPHPTIRALLIRSVAKKAVLKRARRIRIRERELQWMVGWAGLPAGSLDAHTADLVGLLLSCRAPLVALGDGRQCQVGPGVVYSCSYANAGRALSVLSSWLRALTVTCKL